MVRITRPTRERVRVDPNRIRTDRVREDGDASGISVALAGTWDGGYYDSRDGPVDVGSGRVTPWVPLEGSTNLIQSSSADRGTLTTLYFGGVNSVLFDGGNEYMTANALAALVAGNDVAFTLAFNVHLLTVAANDAAVAFGDNATTLPFHIFRTNSSTGSTWEQTRTPDGGGNVSANGGSTGVGVNRVISSFAGTTVTQWVNGTKVVNAAAFNVTSCAFENFSVAARILATVGNFLHGAFLNIAVRTGTISDADAAKLDADWTV